MTPVFCCGFECGVNTSCHFVANGAASFSTSIVRNGSRSGRVNPTASTGFFAPIDILGNSNIKVGRVYVNFATLPSAKIAIFGFATGEGARVGAGFNSDDNKLYSFYSGTPTFGATGISVTTGVWYRIDIKADVSNNPWTIDISVNGLNAAQLTRSVAASTCGNPFMGESTTASTHNMFFDDLIMSNTSADYPLGNGRINHFVPTSDGTHNIAGTGDFQRTLTGTDILNATTTAFQLVDDVPLESGASVDWINMILPPNATDYVECVFGPASGVPTPTYGPRAVEVIAGIHQAGTGTGNMAILLRDNATSGTIYTATGVAGVTSVAYKRAHFATPPSGGTWGVGAGNGNFNNLRFRFGSPAAVDANPDQYLDCIMIEAEFAEWPQKIIQAKQAIKRSNYY